MTKFIILFLSFQFLLADIAFSQEIKGKRARNEALLLTREGIEELQERERNIAEKESLLLEKEKALKIQEKILKDKLKKIGSIQKSIAKKLDYFSNSMAGKVKKLVTIVSAMKPDMAARYFETVEPYLAVEILGQLEAKRAAKILNKVDKEVSARISELYTGYQNNFSKKYKSKPSG